MGRRFQHCGWVIMTQSSTALSIALVVGCFLLSSAAEAQVTNGKSPELPAPFATKSAGNAPEVSKPPKGFLPTGPKGFQVNVFATGFKSPRFWRLRQTAISLWR